MSSMSLPRVLQQRKTSLEQERESFEKNQATSISKAINTAENPVKEKHVRSAILGTFHEKCAETFWAVAHRLPLQENRIAAWKFCHVLHKLLREGHPQALPDSFRHVSWLDDLGKLWVHLKDCYGKLIKEYCSLLKVKITFHRRNPRIPGNLVLTTDELEAIGENDVNNYFQLCVEMFDYLDEILTLQKSIFGSLDMSRSNSMTSCGQCRLAPLIPMIQDSNQLYDMCVKIMFKLHALLPPELVSGHRVRFVEQFKQLRFFYQSASVLQYFRTLIQIPTLPENPPNFLVQSELGTYRTPVVILPVVEDVPETPETPSTGELVDLRYPTNGHMSPDIITERDNLIEHLQNELRRYKMEISKLIEEHKIEMGQMQERMQSLLAELTTKEHELSQERSEKAELLMRSGEVEQYQESEKKLKATDEKFQRLKEVYTKLREEHIQLLRQKADVDKQLSSRKSLEEDACEKAKLEELAQELASLQATADAASEQNQALESKIVYLTDEKIRVESELQDLLVQKEQIEEKLITSSKDAKEATETAQKLFEKVIAECEELVKKAVDEVDNPAFSSSTCSIDYFFSLADPLDKAMNSIEENPSGEHIIRLIHRTSEFVLLGKATSNLSPDIEFGEKMGSVCKEVGEVCLQTLSHLRECPTGPLDMSQMRKSVTGLLQMTEALKSNLHGNSVTVVEELFESELAAMDKAIEEAAKKIEEMLTASRAADSGIKLEVNEKILDSCTGLMQAIRNLVQKARILQAEIVARGKGTASAKEFYKRNHQWTEGLISAAKAVGMGAKYILEAADEVVSGGGGKIEMVVAAAQNISASTALLVVASRVKAERGSPSLAALTVASRGVTEATASVLTSAKACVQLVEQSDDLDMSGLTLHNAKRLEMESQVRVLELESLLTKERLKLSALRRRHYSLAPEADQLLPPV